MLEKWKRQSEAKRGEVIQMKEITFVPRMALRTPIVIHYCVAGKDIFFSSASSNTTSSVNCAEEILTHIWQQEGFNPVYVDFFDVNTHLGYTDLEPGEARISRLALDYEKPCAPGLRFTVKGWHLLEAPTGYPVPERTALTGIPPVIREMFAPYIGTPNPNTPPWNVRLSLRTLGLR